MHGRSFAQKTPATNANPQARADASDARMAELEKALAEAEARASSSEVLVARLRNALAEVERGQEFGGQLRQEVLSLQVVFVLHSHGIQSQITAKDVEIARLHASLQAYDADRDDLHRQVDDKV